VVPARTPVTMPVLVPIVATALLLLLQLPPVVALLSVVVRPSQTLIVPVIEASGGSTVNVNVVIQPVAKVYVMVVVPTRTPVTMPLLVPMVATEMSLLLQEPPVVASLSVVESP